MTTDRLPYRDVLADRAAHFEGGASETSLNAEHARALRWAITQLDSYPTISAYQLPVADADLQTPLVLTVKPWAWDDIGQFLSRIVIPPAGVLLIPEELT